MKCVRIAHDFKRKTSAIIRAAGVSPEEVPLVMSFASKVASEAGLRLSYRNNEEVSGWLEMLPNWEGCLSVEVCKNKLSPIIARIHEKFIVNK